MGWEQKKRGKGLTYRAGSNRKGAVLSAEDRETIAQRLAHGEVGYHIARDYHVSPSLITKIKHQYHIPIYVTTTGK